MMTKREWLQRVAFKRDELLASFDGLSHAGWAMQVWPDWTVHDVLAHMIAWEARVANLLPDLLGDRGLCIAGVDVDAFNAEQVSLRRNRSVRELWDALADSRQRLLTALADVCDEDLVKPRTVPWGELTVEAWALQDLYDHDTEHSAHLRAWRADNPGTGRSLWDALADDMAAQRAGLLGTCLGLDVNTLVSVPVVEDWTVKDLIAHVAFWDDAQTGRAELALAGREAEIANVELSERNAELYLERRDWSLERALQAMQDSRQRCLSVFASASPTQLVRPIHLPWRDTCVWQWAWWRARHDGDHANQIRAWRERGQPEYVSGPRSLLMAALEAARHYLLRYLDRVSPDERDTRCIVADWTAKDLIGHIADWNRFAIQGLQAIRDSRPLPYVGNTDQVNAQQRAARHEQTWNQVWTDIHNTRAELVRILTHWDDEQLARPMDYPFRWGRTPYGWIAMQVWHDRDHADTLRTIQV